MFRADDTRGRRARARALAAQLASLIRLPPPVAWFYLRALATAYRTGDRYSLDIATRPRELAAILALARGRRSAVEIGTGTGWTTIALALADPGRTVESLDVVARPERERYLALAGAGARRRIAFTPRSGDAPPGAGPPVDLLFVDGAHDEASTVAAYRAWEPRLSGDAQVLFHDYGDPAYPGVAAAVRRLGLTGTVHHRLFARR